MSLSQQLKNIKYKYISNKNQLCHTTYDKLKTNKSFNQIPNPNQINTNINKTNQPNQNNQPIYPTQPNQLTRIKSKSKSKEETFFDKSIQDSPLFEKNLTSFSFPKKKKEKEKVNANVLNKSNQIPSSSANKFQIKTLPSIKSNKSNNSIIQSNVKSQNVNIKQKYNKNILKIPRKNENMKNSSSFVEAANKTKTIQNFHAKNDISNLSISSKDNMKNKKNYKLKKGNENIFSPNSNFHNEKDKSILNNVSINENNKQISIGKDKENNDLNLNLKINEKRKFSIIDIPNDSNINFLGLKNNSGDENNEDEESQNNSHVVNENHVKNTKCINSLMDDMNIFQYYNQKNSLISDNSILFKNDNSLMLTTDNLNNKYSDISKTTITPIINKKRNSFFLESPISNLKFISQNDIKTFFQMTKNEISHLTSIKIKAFYLLVESDFLKPQKRLKYSLYSKNLYNIFSKRLKKSYFYSLLRQIKQIDDKYYNKTQIKEDIFNWNFKFSQTTQVVVNMINKKFEDSLFNESKENCHGLNILGNDENLLLNTLFCLFDSDEDEKDKEKKRKSKNNPDNSKSIMSNRSIHQLNQFRNELFKKYKVNSLSKINIYI